MKMSVAACTDQLLWWASLFRVYNFPIVVDMGDYKYKFIDRMMLLIEN